MSCARRPARRWFGAPLPLIGAIAVLSSACATASSGPRSGRRMPLDSAAHAAIQNERSLNPGLFPAQSVAVVPMNITVRDSSLSVLGVGLADLLITDLSQSRQLLVVERLRLDAIMRELQLAASGRVDSVSAPRVGKLVGARRIVVGDITQLPSGDLRVSTRVADTRTSSVTVGANNTTAVDRLLDAEKTLAFGLLASLGVTLTPAERAQIELRPTRNISALLAYSRGVRAEAQGDYRGAAANYREAVRIDPGFTHSRTRASEADTRAAMSEQATVVESGNRLQGIAMLAGDAINRPVVIPVADAVSAPFTATARTATIVITVRVP